MYFELFLTVSGAGPKLAMVIVSALSVEELGAIIADNPHFPIIARVGAVYEDSCELKTNF